MSATSCDEWTQERLLYRTCFEKRQLSAERHLPMYKDMSVEEEEKSEDKEEGELKISRMDWAEG